jgi:hypothetical protein
MYGEAGRRADRLAERVAVRYGVPAEPPLDVYALAARMGVSEIAEVDLTEEGAPGAPCRTDSDPAARRQPA